MKSPGNKPFDSGRGRFLTLVGAAVALVVCLMVFSKLMGGSVSVRLEGAPWCYARVAACLPARRKRRSRASTAPPAAPLSAAPALRHLPRVLPHRRDCGPGPVQQARGQGLLVQHLHDGARPRPPHLFIAPPTPAQPPLLSRPPPAQGTLRRKGDTYDLSWDPPAEVATAHNEAGRGCELSELVKFHDGLYTFDDRTGIMFQLMNYARSDSAEAPFLVPRHIFMEGSGDINDKGLKIEWATQKDGTLLVGSFGKEYTNNKGEVMHSNNLWAVAYKADGTASHVNWKPNYDAMRAALGYQHPGYMIHEAVVWSTYFRKWFVFPRRVSRDPYDDVADEKKGGNTIIMASHDFAEVTATTVGVREWVLPRAPLCTRAPRRPAPR